MARPPLERPPSERYRRPETPPGSGPGEDDAASPRAGLAAAVAAVLGTAVLVLVGGVLEVTTGLLFVAGVTGAAIGLLYAGSDRPRATVRRRSIVAALVVVGTGAVGVWLVALAQGGALGLLDFLWATSGLLVPAELLVAAGAAAWGAGAGPVRG